MKIGLLIWMATCFIIAPISNSIIESNMAFLRFLTDPASCITDQSLVKEKSMVVEVKIIPGYRCDIATPQST
jgi:hypothetical protein